MAEAKRLEQEKNQEQIELGNFDPFKATKKAAEIQEIYDPKLGLIRFGDLSFREGKELDKIDITTTEGKQEKTIAMVHRMLQKAYPELTLEQVESWPMQKVARIGRLFGERIKSFLEKKT